MYRALELAVNPHPSAENFEFVESFGNWLVREASRNLRSWNYTQDAETTLDAERYWVKV